MIIDPEASSSDASTVILDDGSRLGELASLSCVPDNFSVVLGTGVNLDIPSSALQSLSMVSNTHNPSSGTLSER